MLTNIGVDDLHLVLDHLKNVKASCYKIGTALHLKQDELDAIKGESADCTAALIKIITSWLRKNYNLERFGEPTWKVLVEAVANPIGGNNNALAMEIARKHPPGEARYIKHSSSNDYFLLNLSGQHNYCGC